MDGLSDEVVAASDDEDYLQPINPPLPLGGAALSDSISSFGPVTARPVASTKDPISSSSSVPSRPRPKPAFRGAPGRHSSITTDSPGMDTSDLLSSTLSDRVKMRKRVAPKASISGPESISSASPFPKAAVAGDVIEISSSDDELNLDSKRAKPATSKSRSKYNVSPLGAFSSSAFPFPSSNDPALKKTGNPIPFGLAPFPQYSNSRHEQQDDFVPPIATLGGSEDTSYDLQPSPSDLPARKDREKGKSRVKTVKLLLPNHEDQLFDTDAEEHGDSDARRMPPPLLPHDSDRLPPVIPGPSSASGPAAVVPADTISTKPPQKRSHKKKVADDGEKPAKKPRAKKGKKDGEGVDAGEQEKPKAKAKKGKGKDKEVEVFKSTEFVVDSSDNEENPQTRVEPVLPHLPMEVDTPIGGPSVEKPISAISIPDSQPDEELLATTKKRKSSVANDDGGAVDADVEEAAATQKKSKKAKIAGVDAEKKKKKAPAKKAKAKTVVSDDEEGDAGGVESLPQDKMDVDAPVQDEDKTGQEPQHGPVSDPEVDADEPPQNKLKKGKRKQAKKMVLSESEGEDDEVALTKPKSKANAPVNTSSKGQAENKAVDEPSSPKKKKSTESTPKPVTSSLAAQYTIAPRKSIPLADLIMKVNSMPGSPFPVIAPRSRTSSLGGGATPGTPSGLSYSPYNKFSRSALSRIAPLHPNRRTPPPPLPPPPPKPKTKKEKEREERWEEEMIEAIGGWEDWKLLSEQEQKAARRAKWDREMYGWED